MNKEQKEIIEETDIVGPGSILSQARQAQNMSIEEVASTLNFRVTLVKDIEADIYDKTLPDTYNRGYLKNYAKLVGIAIPSIIESYEKLNILQENSAKMQSFSRGTTKKAHNNMLMWVTYLIVAVFIGLTVMWWIQEGVTTSANTPAVTPDKKQNTPVAAASTEELTTEVAEQTTNELINNISDKNEQAPPVVDEANNQSLSNDESHTVALNNTVDLTSTDNPRIDVLDNNVLQNQVADKLVTSIFTFSGDCWVNIYDADGERIAWGIKKSGYVMTLNGKAPFNITIGKPELVDINYDGENVDMSDYRKGHIAKFTLPISPES